MTTPTTSTSASERVRGFAFSAWIVVALNLLVIVWGAFVRASGSGAGCGGHWPLCNGQVVPVLHQGATAVEFAHRVTSGIALVAVFALAFAGRRVFPRGHLARKAAMFGAAFMGAEVLLGAGLVLFDYVAHNSSGGRAVYLSLHLANTQLLLAALTASAWYAGRQSVEVRRIFAPAAASLPLAIMVSITGAIAALGDTLFPASSLAAGVRQDFSSASAMLVQLRVIHPILAIAAGAFFIYAAVAAQRARPGRITQRAVRCVLALVVAQLCAGAINIALLAPVAMQLMHLLLADLLWVALVVLALETGNSIVEPVVLAGSVPA